MVHNHVSQFSIQDLGCNCLDRLTKHWTTITIDQPAGSPRYATPKLQAEASLLAHLVEENWSTQRTADGVRPGLDSLVRRGRFSREVAREMRELVLVVDELQRRMEAGSTVVECVPLALQLASVTAALIDRMGRAQRALRYVFSRETEIAQKAAQLSSCHAEPDPGLEPTLGVSALNPIQRPGIREP